MLNVTPIDTPELGDRSYLIDDGRQALVVDAQRDIDRVLALVEARHLTVSYVVETHMHNDYVTGGLALAHRLGAAYLVNAEDPVAFERQAVSDGDEVQVGALAVRVIFTPGHTQTHLSYLVAAGDERAVFTGGSLLYGATGRSDLLGAHLAEDLTRAQYRSVHRLSEQLPADTAVYPTHGFGSFCAAGQATVADRSTIGEERSGNPALTAPDEETFVRTTLEGLTAYPRYYSHMNYLNLSGPTPPDLSAPEAVDAEELGRRLRRGEWVVDLRARRAYASGHLAGSYGMELGKDFASYLGWVLPWGVSITLLGDSGEDVAKAQRDLVRIGLDRVNGAALDASQLVTKAEQTATYLVSDFAGLAEQLRTGAATVLDVRHDHEWKAGHVQDALHIPFQDLTARVGELPDNAEVWVYCRTGHRASIAASFIEHADRRPVLIDDTWDNAAAAGVPVVYYPRSTVSLSRLGALRHAPVHGAAEAVVALLTVAADHERSR